MEKKCILIADDEQRIVDLVSDFLHAAGYETLKAYDGKQALEIFERQKADLAIIDIMMPEIDGWELTRLIRQSSQLPIIMLSARSEEFDQLTGFEAGVDEYVTKPFSPAVLVKRVEALLKRSEGSQTAFTEQKGLTVDRQAFISVLHG